MFVKIACLLLVGVSLSATKVPPTINANQKLLKIMSAQYSQPANTPQARSVDSYTCFNKYIPILNAITDKLSSDYYNCEKNAANSRENIDQETQWKRKELEKSSDSTYYNLEKCQWVSNAEPYFECYQNAAAINSKIMYNISMSAGDALLEVRESVRLIVIKEDSCKATADRAYVENTSKTYEDMNNCLNGV